MDSFMKRMEKKGIQRWFRRDNLLILVLSGILLFIIALPTKEPGEGAAKAGKKAAEDARWEQPGPGEENAARQTGQGGGRTDTGTAFLSGEEYCTYLEERLEEILSGAAGAGRVKVMITLKSSEELVVEKDKQVKRSAGNEQDSRGGSRVTNQTDTSETTLYSTVEGGESPYVVKRILPAVEGVVVVAKGAGNGTVNRNITEMVQALFDIEAHKIKVVKMEAAN